MIKLFAILTVLAALPVSALAEMTTVSNAAGIHCTKDVVDSAYSAPVAVAAAPVSADATIAQ